MTFDHGKIRDNPLYLHELSRWSGARAQSRRLVWAVLIFSGLLTLYVRRFTFGIDYDWLMLGQPWNPFLRDLERFLLAEPRLLLGIVIGMWCIDDAYRQVESGQLDQIVLTRLTGYEILEAKVLSMPRWALGALAIWALAQALDALALGWFGYLRLETTFLEVGFAPLRALEMFALIMAAAALAWREILTNVDAFAMLRRVALWFAGFSVAAFAFHWLLARAVFASLKYLQGSWLQTVDFDINFWLYALTETVYFGLLATTWWLLARRQIRDLGRSFHRLYTTS